MSASGRPPLSPSQMRIKMDKELEKSQANRIWIIQYLFNKEIGGVENINDGELREYLMSEIDEVRKELRILRNTGWVTYTVAGENCLDVKLTGNGFKDIERSVSSFQPPSPSEINDPEYDDQTRLAILKEENLGKKFDLMLGIMKFTNMVERIWHHIIGQS